MDAGGHEGWTEHVLPHAAVDLVLVIEGRYRRRVSESVERIADARVVGVHLAPVEYVHARGDRLVGVRFRPAGLAAFGARGPASELVDRCAPARDVLGPAFTRSVLAAGGAPAGDALDSLERVLIERLAPCDRHAAMREAIALLDRGRPVAEVAARVGLGVRALERAMDRLVGLAPKRHQSLRRFERAVAALDRRHAREGFGVLHELGYADQPHFIREYRRWAGAPPSSRWRAAP